MDDKAFSAQLCAWLNPESVAQAAAGYDVSQQIANANAEFRFPRAAAEEAQSIGLDRLIDKFLAGFEMPAEYLHLLGPRYPNISQSAWDWVAGLRFAGQVRYSGFRSDQADDTAAVLNDRWALGLLVSGPINFLIKHTASLVPLWRFTADQRVGFFEHSSYSELLVFIEYTVATAQGNADVVRSAQPSRATVMYGDGTLGFSRIDAPPFRDDTAMRSMYDDMYRGLEERWRQQGARAPVPDDRSHDYDFTAHPPTHLPKLGEQAGFFTIAESEAVQAWRNISRWRNEYSPYSIMRSQRQSGLTIDSYYGRVFDFALEENFGVYGITDALPVPPWSRSATSFLRIPYRKVPRYFVKNRAELDAALQSATVLGDGSSLVYRGQDREYTLARSPNAGEVLYGDRTTIEPSLLASSVRSQQPLEAVLPAWCLLVRLFLDQIWSLQLGMPELEEYWPIIQEDAVRLRTGLDLHLYAIAMAQHYGLPSMGLDVTENLETALFFALHKAEASRPGRILSYRRKRAGDPQGVLYVLAPDERYRLNHELSRPRTIGGGRPERQGAKFLMTGWGYHRNAVARHLALALYLDPSGNFGPLPSAQQLFPDQNNDLFGQFLENTLKQGLLPKELGRYVEQLYWVVEN